MITVVIPAYNAIKFLPACLKAIRRQSLPADEIIVVDDGSSDQTSRVAEENGARVLPQSHRGPAAARNLGVKQARGEIVLFTDADCEPEPDWVEQLMVPFSDPLVAGVRGVCKTRQSEAVARLVQCEFEERYDRQEGQPSIDLVDSSSAAFRVAVLRSMGGFDPAFPRADNEDVELSYRLERAGQRLVFNRQAVVYHRHPITWWAYFRRKIRRGYWRMLVYRSFPGKAVRDSYTPQLLKLQIMLMYLGLGCLAIAPRLPDAGWGVLISLVSLLVSAIPFTRRARQYGRDLTLIAYLFILLRAFAFSIGIIGGVVGMFFFHPSRLGTAGDVDVNALDIR